MNVMLDSNLLDGLAANADEAEAQRRLPDASMELLRDADLLRLLVPSRVGGTEAGLREMVEAVEGIGRVDGAASWVLMVLVAHDWMMGSFSEDTQDAVYRDGPDAVIPGSLAPAGAAARADGGWIVSGRWPFASGADHGDWYLLGTVERVDPATTDATKRPRLLHIVVPRSDVVVDDTWHPIGLRGTGSCDVVLDEVFIPDLFAMDSGALLGGRSEWSERHPTSVYRIPILPGLAVHVAASAIGIAQSGLDDMAARLTDQRDAYLGSSKSDRPGLQMRLAESTTELHTARLLIADTIDRLDHAAAGHDSKELRAETKYRASYAIDLCRRSLDRVATAAGARAMFDGSRLQRAHRDVSMASQHAVADLDTVGQAYGRTLLGMDPGPHPL